MPATMQSTVPSTTLRRSLRWRVVDIVVASVLAVAIGVVFKLWEFGYEPLSAGAALVLPGSQSLFGGVWLLAGPIVAIVVRKPGAALYAEMVAASVEALLGTQWGWLTLEAGLVQGLGAELVLALFLYRVYRLPVVVTRGSTSGSRPSTSCAPWSPAPSSRVPGPGPSSGRSPRPESCRSSRSAGSTPSARPAARRDGRVRRSRGRSARDRGPGEHRPGRHRLP
ncbi:ECF transporter S component [Curtobacterium sp. Csp1]|uniref:ECF transporter S component n=1 Tax=Curtobacterium sp. Csp1 TaxID=2495429 RepID=UPI0034A0C41F